jgi:Tol biopolymer transport system component
MLLTAAAAFVAGKQSARVIPPAFKQLTFRRGTIWRARFAPDGRVVYAAAWDGEPVAVFEKQLDNPDSRPLGLPPETEILAISPTGQIAVSLRRHWSGPFQHAGMLAQTAIGGGAPRELLNEVHEADWAGDGKELMIIRDIGTRSRIELPIGHVLYETPGWVSSARVSRDGSEVAFLEHAILNDDGGSVAIVDPHGKKITLSSLYQSIQGLAWSPDNREVWFTASKEGGNRSLYAVDRAKRERILASVPGSIALHDVSRDGRILVTQENHRIRTYGAKDGKERDLTWFDSTLPLDITNDGKQVLIVESGEGGGPGYSAYIRGTDGSPPVRLGDGAAMKISPDQRFALTIRSTSAEAEIVLYPTGAGQSVKLSNPNLTVHSADFMPNAKQVVFTASAAGHAPRLYIQDLVGGAARAISPEGYRQLRGTVSPDGRWVLVSGPDQDKLLFPTSGGNPQPLPGLNPNEVPTRWTADGSAVYVFSSGEIPARGFRVNVRTGERQPWREFQPAERAGITDVVLPLPTPDGKGYVVGYRQQLSDLFLIERLR